MATILLGAAGAAIGGAIGGGALGLSSVVIGRAIGATLGRAIDARLMGSGSEVVETGRLDRLRIMGASEGGGIPRIFGRMRVAGNVIWSSRYREEVTTTQVSGGKGAPKGPSTRSFSYSVSVAIALCDGEIGRIGRIWADGDIVPASELNMRVYKGADDQLSDPVMTAIEGAGNVPAYRGLAYVVMEDLPLAKFGNRVPQFAFEVIRPARPKGEAGPVSGPASVNAVALMPGTGEFALGTTPVYKSDGLGGQRAINVNTAQGNADLTGSIDALTGELPNSKSVSLVVSWFGDDLRAGECAVIPKVESAQGSGSGLGSAPVSDGGGSAQWSVSGISRADAEIVAQVDGRPVYGGTPSDATIVEAIEALHDVGQTVMFYPFLLMEILDGNSLPDPWSDAQTQPALPWRGRITTQKALGQPGSTDKTAGAADEVAAFMGNAAPGDFEISGTSVRFTGEMPGGYRHFILHYAYLCKALGGVDAFCVGSEMRSLTQIRDMTGGFPAVEALRALTAEVRAILGPDCKIGYAADWSEYFGYSVPDGSGDHHFHLDPLWSDENIDFIGIDNYMPISDWRDGGDHLDADAKSIYNLDYLRANIAGGEGYEWYYRDPEERFLQIRTPIEDGAYGKPWIYRYKDIANWWSEQHFDRIGGVEAGEATAWVPGSKPIWFTELGCAAIDKGPNEPNKFQDPKSSESALPHFSTGRRDDYVQAQYLRAWHSFYEIAENNPVSSLYGGPMVDMERAYIWAWDARPWPDFPANLDVWSDGGNHVTGHWLTGRAALQSLSHVVAEICETAGITAYDVTELHGVVRGFALGDVETPRASLQVLMTVYGFDAIEQQGVLVFRNRALAPVRVVDPAEMVILDNDTVLETIRAPEAEVVGDVRVGYTEAEGSFQIRVAGARFPGDTARDATQNEVPLTLTETEARGVAERWLSEAQVARDRISFAVPMSRSDLKAGDQVDLRPSGGGLFRIDRVEDQSSRMIEAVRVEPNVYEPSDHVEAQAEIRPFTVPIPVAAQFMDLPLLTGEEVPHAPYLAVTAEPWPGGAAVYASSTDNGYGLNALIERPSVMGVLQSALPKADPWIWDTGDGFDVVLARGALSSTGRGDVLNGMNVAAIGDGSSDLWEIIQFSEAELVAPATYRIRDLLRGQAGSEPLMPGIWPAGSRFVLLDGAPQQLDLDISQRDLARHYRVGPAQRPFDDPSFQHYLEAFAGNGLRPYAPAHLRVTPDGNDTLVSWVRRTRIDGDSWSGVEVPLGEEDERYLLQVVQNGSVLRELELNTPEWRYFAYLRAQDGPDISLRVAQVSLRYGPGLFAEIELND